MTNKLRQTDKSNLEKIPYHIIRKNNIIYSYTSHFIKDRCKKKKKMYNFWNKLFIIVSRIILSKTRLQYIFKKIYPMYRFLIN